MNETVKKTNHLDARGWTGTWCILQARSLMRTMRAGEILEVRAADPAVLGDLVRALKDIGKSLDGVTGGNGEFRMRVQKMGKRGGRKNGFCCSSKS